MQGLYGARRAVALAALIPLTMLFTRLAFSQNDPQDDEWKAPVRAASLRNPITADDKSLSIGKSLYFKECASCHGESGRGNGPEAANLPRQPSDLSAAPVRQQRDGELFWKITEGRKPMP